MAEDGQGQARAVLLGVEGVLDVEEVRLDLVEVAAQVEVETGVVEGAVLHLPVVARIAQHTVVQRRERLGAGAVSACSVPSPRPRWSRPSSVPLGAMNGSNMGNSLTSSVDATGDLHYLAA